MLTPNRGLPIQIAYLLVPEFSMMAFSAAIEPLRAANRLSERRLFEWKLASADGRDVRASNGILIAPHASLAQLTKINMLVVCAGLDLAPFSPGHRIHHHLRRLTHHGAMVGAISTGSFLLAEAGLLGGHRCTVHWEYADLFQKRFPALEVSRDLYVVDRGVFTCSGGTAALDMMLHFISQASSPDLAIAVAEQFIHPYLRKQEDNQRLGIHTRYEIASPKLVEVIRLMESSLADPLDIRHIADRISISSRQIERLFRDQVGASPKTFYLNLRLARARTLLRQTVAPILDVAVECGFGSTSHLCHAYKRIYGVPPAAERKGAARRSTKSIAAKRKSCANPAVDYQGSALPISVRRCAT